MVRLRGLVSLLGGPGWLDLGARLSAWRTRVVRLRGLVSLPWRTRVVRLRGLDPLPGGPGWLDLGD